ncbi:MAG: alanine racemase [bacterium]|jgi:predicted amino acid racemase
MATLTINIDRILGNIRKLNAYLSDHDITWSLVTKMLSGYPPILEPLLEAPCMKSLHSVGDSRISNLRVIKKIRPDIVTIYIKPPAVNQARNVIRYADISLNTTYRTILELSKEATRYGKVHRIVIMLELGELREGIARDNVIEFYERVFHLPNIRVIGLGTNLGCMFGIEPTYDKLIQLNLFAQLVKARFQQDFELISGGSSITLPLLGRGKIPRGVNHLRIGETAFLGRSLLTGRRFRDLSTNAFDFSAEIVEIEKKSSMPDGRISDASVGHAVGSDRTVEEDGQEYRCLVDFGQVDVGLDDLTIKDRGIRFVGTTSDMTVYSLGKDKRKWKVGKQMQFSPNYMAVARLMNNRYVEKKVVRSVPGEEP